LTGRRKREIRETREDAAYAAIQRVLRERGLAIAVFLPLVFVVLWETGRWALIVAAIWLVELIGYAALNMLHGARLGDAPGAFRRIGTGLGFKVTSMVAVVAVLAIQQARDVIFP